MLGLKRGAVALFPHEIAWEKEAENTIIRLKNILVDDAEDIQHVGSTAIKTIYAKPIIDIAVGVNDFENVMKYKAELEDNGFYFRNSSIENQLLFACGSYYNKTGELQTHFIHVVIYKSKEWNDYINFRDYMNNNINAAKAYESLKLKLAAETPIDKGREKYLAGKYDFIKNALKIASKREVIGKNVNVIVDRPLGSRHPRYKDMVYPMNYGYVKGVLAEDGEEQDVYILGIDRPVEIFNGTVIAVIHRKNDLEDKWVAVPENVSFSREDIIRSTYFQEQFFDSEIIM